MKKTLLTAIIFTYNHEKSIAHCIESLVNQNTDYGYEIHIWDDCSIDGTSDICREYAAKYPEKIKLTIQKENTFLKPYLELQSFAAINQIKTPYFCIIDGDDHWCHENKIQTALDFLENNPDYIGFAHDTWQVEEITGKKQSYIHECLKANVQNPVEFSADAPFFLTSSRIFRWMDYTKLNILPIDYLFYYYHSSKGKIYYHDEIMAAYVIGEQSTFANCGDIANLNSMFAYKLSLLFNFEQDNFCTQYQKDMDLRNGLGLKRYNLLLAFKRFFGTKYGWKLWFSTIFAWRYGLKSANINYVFSHKKVKEKADSSCNSLACYNKTSKFHLKIFLLEALLARPLAMKTTYKLYAYMRKILKKPMYIESSEQAYLQRKIDTYQIQLKYYYAKLIKINETNDIQGDNK